MPKYHRIQIDDRAYKALIAESIGRDGVDIRDIASQILIDGVSKEALTYSGQFSATSDEIQAPVSEPGSETSKTSNEEVARHIAKKAPPTGKMRGGKKVPISDEIKAEVRKRKLEDGEISNRKIAQEIGISPAMVNKILSDKGDLTE
jgi:hypothetical protein